MLKDETKVNLLFNHGLSVDDRTVFLFKDVDNITALELIKNLMFLDKTPGDIKLIINSQGGSVVDGMAIIDCLFKLKNNVYGHVPGQACSMAVDILQACTIRGMAKNASLLIHAGSISVNAEVTAAINQTNSMAMDLELSIDMYLKRVKIGKKKLKELLSTDTFLYSKEALRMGFIDKID